MECAVLDSWHILHLHDKQVKQQVRCPASLQARQRNAALPVVSQRVRCPASELQGLS
jgi:hypothetical protein